MTSTSRRRWFQFRLRTLPVLMLVISCGLGWFAYHLQLARNRERAVAECSAAGIYVYQYEPTAAGKVLRRWPALDQWVQATFGDSLLSTPSAVSAFHIQKDRVEFLKSRLKQFPSLKSVSLGYADRDTLAVMQEEFPDVDIVLRFYK
jgi:hypothetical protein